MISIIVPVYKVEDYLDRCVKSLVNQTYKDIQIILVNDGSPDHCGDMCNNWAHLDKRICVIHKENGGLSDARNAGATAVKGDYIAYVDSDDWIAEDFLESMLEIAKETKSDIVECLAKKVYSESDTIKTDNKTTSLILECYTKEDALKLLIEDTVYHQHVWNKLYRTDLVLSIPFEVGKINEDEFWTYQVFGKANKVARIERELYYYFQRSESIMGKGYSLKRLDALIAKAERQKYIDSNFPTLSECAKLNLIISCMHASYMSIESLSLTDKKMAFALIRQIIKQNRLDRDEILKLSRKRRIWIPFFCKFPKIFSLVRYLFKIGV